MVLSLGLVAIAVVLFVGLTPRRHYDAVHQIDYSAPLRDAQNVAPFHIFAPTGLSPGWRPTSVRYDGNVHGRAQWHLGFVSPKDAYVGLEETNGPSRDFIFNLSNRGLKDGTMVVDGAVWDRYLRNARSVRSIARVEGNVTILITGTATYDELGELATTLR
jgi:hypothetical protein